MNTAGGIFFGMDTAANGQQHSKKKKKKEKKGKKFEAYERYNLPFCVEISCCRPTECCLSGGWSIGSLTIGQDWEMSPYHG